MRACRSLVWRMVRVRTSAVRCEQTSRYRPSRTLERLRINTIVSWGVAARPPDGFAVVILEEALFESGGDGLVAGSCLNADRVGRRIAEIAMDEAAGRIDRGTIR